MIRTDKLWLELEEPTETNFRHENRSEIVFIADRHSKSKFKVFRGTLNDHHGTHFENPCNRLLHPHCSDG